MRIRRSTFALYCLHDAGVASTQPQHVFAFSVLTGRPEPVTIDELSWLHRLPAEAWQPLDAASSAPSPDTWRTLADKGLVLVDGSGQPHLDELRRRHDQLDGDAWNGIAATYHFLGKWHDAHLEDEDTEEAAEDALAPDDGSMLDPEEAAAFLARHGHAPPHFHAITDPSQTDFLPVVDHQGGLWDTLARRRTTRAFDPTRPVSRTQLATVLRYTFGCHGTAPMFDGVEGLKKTSPSGGGLHPIEIYPLVLGVDDVEPGLYHYNVAEHRLDQLDAMSSREARLLASELTAGQRYTRRAGVLFLMTARFFRNFWKYRRHDKAYGVLLMDAAHLSQTLYLVCAELGLGAFFTAAVNGQNIENRLGIDGFEEGAIAVCGCGVAAEGPNRLEPRFEAFRSSREAQRTGAQRTRAQPTGAQRTGAQRTGAS